MYIIIIIGGGGGGRGQPHAVFGGLMVHFWRVAAVVQGAEDSPHVTMQPVIKHMNVALVSLLVSVRCDTALVRVCLRSSSRNKSRR